MQSTACDVAFEYTRPDTEEDTCNQQNQYAIT